jgi:plasmid stabilization system protein ParE
MHVQPGTVARSLRSLERFPRMGPALHGRWEGQRFLLGPWRWMVLVYAYIEAEDRVVVIAVHDARPSAAATASRGPGVA